MIICLSFKLHPFLYSSPQESSVGAYNFKHYLMKKSGGVRHVFPPFLAPTTPAPLACKHQRPELILCEAGPAPSPSGITCLTLACGSDAPRTIRERRGNIDKVSAVFRAHFANYASSCTATVKRVFVRCDYLS